MKVIKRIVVLIFLISSWSCSSELKPREFIDWVKSDASGFHKTKGLAPYQFNVQYKPISYKILQEENKVMTKEAFQRRLEQEQGMVYFDVQLGLAESEIDLLKYESVNTADYQQKLYYFSFSFQNDIYLEQNGKKYPCSIYHFERSFNLKGNRSFLLGFDTGNISATTSTLVFDSKVLDVGIVKIRFDNTQQLPVVNWGA